MFQGSQKTWIGRSDNEEKVMEMEREMDMDVNHGGAIGKWK